VTILRRFGLEAAMLVAAITSVAALVAYWGDANIQWIGGLIAVALIAVGIGLVAWAQTAMPDEVTMDDREVLESTPEERAAFVADFVEGERSITRRRLLGASLLAVGGALGATFLSMFRALGPDPYPILESTRWRPGSRLISENGRPLKPSDLRVGGAITVFPEGHFEDAQAQTLLINVGADALQLPEGRESWAYEGLVAYSKVCTHAACPVGLYQERQQLLLCPCHQSTFDVVHGAEPTSGPAARALPQLPISVDTEGYLVAQSDFAEPVGPTFWRKT
jgi:ubiquinol-cytochrome c reductase iron-sulfur subunit